jgi:integrase
LQRCVELKLIHSVLIGHLRSVRMFPTCAMVSGGQTKKQAPQWRVRGAKVPIDLSPNATGLLMTVHQFRHAAGAIILKRRPGEYELVRRLLGHRNVQTTINAYVGLER